MIMIDIYDFHFSILAQRPSKETFMDPRAPVLERKIKTWQKFTIKEWE